jgi:hypothetical protein
LALPNLFSAQQGFLGGIYLPASVPEAGASGVIDSAPLSFDSTAPDPQTNAETQTRFSWIAQPNLESSSGRGARLALLFGRNGTPPAPTGLTINADGTIAFATNQVLPSAAVLAALSGDQNGASGSSGNAGLPPVVTTAQYSWTQTPRSAPSISLGANEITMTPCPRGVNGTDLWHFVYISGTGTPEVVLITGGSCISGATRGTIQFSASYAHPPGFAIGTATDGLQEASVAAVMPDTNGQISRQVLITPGTHLLRARLSLRGSSLLVRSSGATVVCAMSDTCIMMGDPANANTFSMITLDGLRMSAGILGGTWPAVEDNANGSTIANLGPAPPAVLGGSFGEMVQVDNDQKAVIDNLNTNLAGWARCDTTFCSRGVYGPGPFSENAGVITVKNSNLGLQCMANGIDNQDGNTLKVTDSVIEAYTQFGVRSRSTYVAVNVTMANDYLEIGNCSNPLGTGEAGLIVEGGTANVTSTVGPQGALPQFGNTGLTRYNYYVVANSDIMGTSAPFLAGFAMTNGSGPIKGLFNQIGSTGNIAYDILRIPGDGGMDMAAPYGTGLFAVATGIPATTCSNKVCSFVDDAAVQPVQYTVNSGLFWPALTLWPGAVILTQAFDLQQTGGLTPTQLSTDNLGSSSFGGIVSSAGGSAPSVTAQMCQPQGSWSSTWIQCLGGNAVSNNNPVVTATVFQLSANGGAPGGLKGRLIIENPPDSSVSSTHVITLADSNPRKTTATPNNRPSYDANDTYIGYDQPTNVPVSQTQLSFGAPTSISNYIANVGDGEHFLERLTAFAKVFRVPVQMSQISTGSSSNTDVAGVISIVGGTSESYLFTGKQKVPPSCTLTPMGDPSRTGTYWENITTEQLTAIIQLPGTISFSYHCWSLNPDVTEIGH